MAQVTLYCKDTPGLKLGPGVGRGQIAGQQIVFTDGFATFENDDFPDWAKWAFAPGTPRIEILEEGDGRAPGGEELMCDICGKGPFKAQIGLNSHLRSHAPKPAE